jgi:hypothetical protein
VCPLNSLKELISCQLARKQRPGPKADNEGYRPHRLS